MTSRKNSDAEKRIKAFSKDHPALSAYLRRVGAELRNFRRATISDTDGGYRRDRLSIRIAPDGSIDCPDEVKPTADEADKIKAEFAAKPPPANAAYSFSGRQFDAARTLGVAADGSEFFVFRNAQHDAVLMVEQRVHTNDGKKQPTPWSYWDDGRSGFWMPMEPEGPLPLWGLDQLKDHSVVILHEGPKAARAAREMVEGKSHEAREALKAHPWREDLSHAAHIGWPGGVHRWRDVDWIPLKRRDINIIYIVADNDDGGKRAAAHIARELDAPNRHVRVLFFDDRFPIGFDLADPFPNKFFEQQQDGTRRYVGPASMELWLPVTPEAWVDHMNRRYSVVTVGGKTRVLRFLADETGREAASYMAFRDFRDFYSNEHVLLKARAKGKDKEQAVPVGQFWLTHKDRRTYEGVVFEPGGEPVVGEQLNLWRGFGVEPKPGDWSLMREHIRTILANGDHEMDEFIVRWSAWKIQNPGKPCEVALVFRGGEGTGKGFFARALCTLFGRHSHHISDRRHLTGNFNAHLRDCCLLFADEAFWPGDKSGEGTLKRIITEPSLTIELKGVDVFSAKNRLGAILASNEDWVVPASIGARRFAVSDVSDAQKEKRSYFDPLQGQLDNGGYEAMLHDLQTMDLEGWRPLGNIPQNAALLDQKLLSLKPTEQFLFDVCQAGALPGVTRHSLYSEPDPRRTSFEALRKHARETVPRMQHVSDTELGKALREFGCVHRGRIGTSRAWVFPPLADCRSKWEKLLPLIVWEDPDQEDWSYAM